VLKGLKKKDLLVSLLFNGELPTFFFFFTVERTFLGNRVCAERVTFFGLLIADTTKNTNHRTKQTHNQNGEQRQRITRQIDRRAKEKKKKNTTKGNEKILTRDELSMHCDGFVFRCSLYFVVWVISVFLWFCFFFFFLAVFFFVCFVSQAALDVQKGRFASDYPSLLAAVESYKSANDGATGLESFLQNLFFFFFFFFVFLFSLALVDRSTLLFSFSLFSCYCCW
jgi:hypothetical protein